MTRYDDGDYGDHDRQRGGLVRALRWMQLNTRANEVGAFDVAWWGDYWTRCRAEGVTVNAGGIVAFYPTEVPFHRRAPGVERRDLLGEIVAEARRRETGEPGPAEWPIPPIVDREIAVVDLEG